MLSVELIGHSSRICSPEVAENTGLNNDGMKGWKQSLSIFIQLFTESSNKKLSTALSTDIANLSFIGNLVYGVTYKRCQRPSVVRTNNIILQSTSSGLS